MREYVELGPTPAEESCAQVGEANYHIVARQECLKYIALIRSACGTEPDGAQLGMRSFPHDFGSYLEVVCYYHEEYPESIEYAYAVEKDAPTRWED